MAPNPRVSVFIACYNHAGFLPECLDSILNQTYQDFEIVIVDDGSTDNSYAIMKDYEMRFSGKVRVFTHPGHVNKGVSATANLAISYSRGEYLAWIGSDDVWYPEKLALQVEYLELHPNIGLVYSYAHFIDASSNLLPGLLGVDVTQRSNPLGDILINDHVPPQTILITRSCLLDVGVFEDNMVNSDWEWTIRICARWAVGFIDKPTTQYRLHTTNISKGIDPKITLDRDLRLYLTVLRKINEISGKILLPRNLAILRLQLVFHQFCAGQLKEAVDNLAQAFQADETLRDDLTYFNDWLNNWKPEFYNTTHNHFGLWVIDHLSEHVSQSFLKKLIDLQLNHTDTIDFFIRRGSDLDSNQDTPIAGDELFNDWPSSIPLTSFWKNQVMKKLFPELLFKNYQHGVLSKLRFYWVKTIQYDPSWLKNRGVWSIGVKILFSGMRLLRI